MTMCETRLVTTCSPERLPSVYQYHVPAFCCFPRQHCPRQTEPQRQYCPGGGLYSSASSIHRPVGSRSHPHDSKPSASRRSPPASLDPSFLSPLRSMCWAAAPATRLVCCVENFAQHPRPKKMLEVLGNLALMGGSKGAQDLDVEGIVDIVRIVLWGSESS